MEKCMKKFLSVLLVLFVLSGSVFAYQNVYRLSSDEVQTFLLLRKVSASLTPDPTYPVSAEQLSNLVKSLDTSKFNDNFMKMYNDLIDELDHPQVIFEKDGAGIDQQVDIIGVQLYKVNDPDIFMPYKDRIPMANLETDLYFGKHFFGRAGLDPRKDYNQKEKDMTTILNVMDYNEGLPFIPMASAGYGNLNLTVGRDRLGAGNGFTGNLTLGENSVFDDFVKLSYVNSLMSYDFTYKHYKTDYSSVYKQPDTKNLYVHRFSVNFFDRVNFSMFEGVLAAGHYPIPDEGNGDHPFDKMINSNNFDFDYLNPFMLLHNTFKYYSGNVNNFIGFEVTGKLDSGWQLHGQFFLDQINFMGEDVVLSGETAYIALANASKTFTVGNGVLDFYAETVYGNPYVYLKNYHGYGINNGGNYNSNSFFRDNYKQNKLYERIDLVADYLIDLNEGITTDRQYLGYKYGGDLFTIATGAKYRVGKLRLNANLQYIAKGDLGIWDGEKRLAHGRDNNDPEYAGTISELAVRENIIQHTFLAEMNAGYTFAKGIEVSGRVAALGNINYHHEKKPLAFDFQYAFGVNVHVLDFFDIRKTL